MCFRESFVRRLTQTHFTQALGDVLQDKHTEELLIPLNALIDLQTIIEEFSLPMVTEGGGF